MCPGYKEIQAECPMYWLIIKKDGALCSLILGTSIECECSRIVVNVDDNKRLFNKIPDTSTLPDKISMPIRKLIWMDVDTLINCGKIVGVVNPFLLGKLSGSQFT